MRRKRNAEVLFSKKLNHFYHNVSYHRQIVIICFLVSILPLSITGLFCYNYTLSLLRVQQLNSVVSTVNNIGANIQEKLTLFENLISYMATSSPIVDCPYQSEGKGVDDYIYLSTSLDIFLGNMYALHPEIQQITLYNADGQLVHGQQLRPVSDLSEENWYTDTAVSAKPAWYLKNDGSLILIQKIANPYAQYLESYSDNYLAITFKTGVFFKNLLSAADPFFLDITSGDQSLYYYSSDGLPREEALSSDSWVHSSCSFSKVNWILSLSFRSNTIFLPVHRMAVVILLLILLCILLVFAAGNITGSFFGRSIRKLHSYMNQVKAGNLDLHIHDDGRNEIADLTNNLQEMVDQINRLIAENYKNQLVIKDVQLKALQAQINPHFLYNCLSLINNKALLNDQPEISQMSQLLSVFYRTTLNKGKPDTSIEDEIKNVSSYITIQQLLHDNCFDVMYQIDKNLPAQRIPNLLLQPLVENAIIHGILPNREKRGQLFLSINRVNSSIRVSVMDNGCGISEEKIPLLLQTDSPGYGLKNVHDRLILTYGPESGLKIHSIPHESTMISFEIPIQTE